MGQLLTIIFGVIGLVIGLAVGVWWLCFVFAALPVTFVFVRGFIRGWMRF